MTRDVASGLSGRGDLLSPKVAAAFAGIASRFANEGVSTDVTLELAPELIRRYPSFAAWPFDAQVGLLLMAWMKGAGFHLAGFRQAVTRLIPDFAGASEACFFDARGHSGVIALGDRCRALFQNAAVTLKRGMDVEKVYYPLAL